MTGSSTSTARLPVPQSGCEADTTPPPVPQNLWQHLLATLGEVGYMIDPFAMDAHPNVRKLGRLARQRYPQAANDYFVLGDLCACLSLEGSYLSQVYAEKAIIAYQRASECLPGEDDTARTMIRRFLEWIVAVACTLDTVVALQKGMFVCECALRVECIASDSQISPQVRTMYDRLHRQISRMNNHHVGLNEISPERLSRQLCDEGQTLLRQQKIPEALEMLARAIKCDEQNSKAWLWQALALSDSARFDEAIACYNRAIQLDPSDYGTWNSLGSLWLELGRIDEAVQCFDQALAMPLAPTVVRAAFLLNKGKALYMKGQYHAAQAVLEQSNALDATPESMSGIAACSEMINRMSTATQPDDHSCPGD